MKASSYSSSSSPVVFELEGSSSCRSTEEDCSHCSSCIFEFKLANKILYNHAFKLIKRLILNLISRSNFDWIANTRPSLNIASRYIYSEYSHQHNPLKFNSPFRFGWMPGRISKVKERKGGGSVVREQIVDEIESSSLFMQIDHENSLQFAAILYLKRKKSLKLSCSTSETSQ